VASISRAIAFLASLVSCSPPHAYPRLELPADLIAEEGPHVVGVPTVYEVQSPTPGFRVILEDDGETIYFYAVAFDSTDQTILDALLVANVADLPFRDERAATYQIAWSRSGQQALLAFEGVPTAAFDFAARRGFARSNFPPPTGAWSTDGHAWSDAVLEHFRPERR
jgi:hypothetical protein